MAKIEKRPTGEFSSYYGCYIIAMAALMFLGMIGWTAWSFFAQDRALSLITQDQPVQLPITPLPPDKESALMAKLRSFGEASKAGLPAELSLSLDDLNQIVRLAPDTGYGTYREIVHFTHTDPARSTIAADLCMPLKKMKFWEGKFRYLVGEGVFKIEVHEEGVDAKLIDVTVPGRKVPEGFVGNLEIWPWVAPYRKQEPIGSMLKGIKRATVTTDGLNLSTTR